jgi:hypothetical protein
VARKPVQLPAEGQGKTSSSLSLPGLLGDFRLLLILFVAFRIMLLMVYQPLLLQDVERGITTGGDFQTYFQIASLSKTVGLPLRDWWSEFPPLWSYLSVVVYQLQGANASYGGFAMLLSIIFLAADTGNLILIRKIAAHLYKPETGSALAWVYALLLAPLVFTFWTFEALVVFTLLLGVWWLLKRQDMRSALAITVGTLIKFTPALALGAVWRMRDIRRAVRYTLVWIGLVFLVYIPFFAQNAAMTLPSLTAQFSKASYESIWALIDGNYRTGNFGPLTERLDPANASNMQGNPPRIPGWMRLGIAGAVGLFVFARTRRFDDKGLVAFVGITLLIFFLQAQGWSPQWVTQIIPFVLLCFPTRNGVIIVILLSLATFAEYPFLFIRTGDTGGEITGALVMPYTILILARTGILVGLSVAFFGILRQVREQAFVA